MAHIYALFDHERPELQNRLPPEQLELIPRWQTMRRARYGEIPLQSRPFSLIVQQDDIVAFALDEAFASLLDIWIPELLQRELQIKLSDKPAATIPFSRVFEANGARFELSTSRPFVQPRLETLESFYTKSFPIAEGRTR